MSTNILFLSIKGNPDRKLQPKDFSGTDLLKKQESLYISSHSRDALNLSQFLTARDQRPIYLSSILDPTRDIPFYQNLQFRQQISLLFHEYPQSHSSIWALMKYLTQKQKSALFIMNQLQIKSLMNFEQDLTHKRDLNPSMKILELRKGILEARYNELDPEALKKREKERKIKEILQINEQKAQVQIQFKLQHLNKELLRSKKFAEAIKEEAKSKKRKQENFDFENLQNEIQNLGDSLNYVEQTLVNLQKRADNCLPVGSFRGQLVIKQFTYNLDQENSQWTLKIQNSTLQNFKNVKVYQIQSQRLITFFKLIEAESILEYNVKLEYQADHYNTHLILMSQERIASVPFSIVPVEFLKVEWFDQNKFLVTVENKSNQIFQQIYLVSPHINKKFFSNRRKHTQQQEEKMKFQFEGQVQEIELYVMSKNIIISNIYKATLEFEENKEQMNERGMSIGKSLKMKDFKRKQNQIYQKPSISPQRPPIQISPFNIMQQEVQQIIIPSLTSSQQQPQISNNPNLIIPTLPDFNLTNQALINPSASSDKPLQKLKVPVLIEQRTLTSQQMKRVSILEDYYPILKDYPQAVIEAVIETDLPQFNHDPVGAAVDLLAKKGIISISSPN